MVVGWPFEKKKRRTCKHWGKKKKKKKKGGKSEQRMRTGEANVMGKRKRRMPACEKRGKGKSISCVWDAPSSCIRIRQYIEEAG